MSQPTDAILRGVVDLHTREELEVKLKRDRPLRVKLGVDPTSKDIHLGHTVVLRKLRQFQDAGHQAILIIGDFTALVGDPTGQSKTRPPLTPEQVDENAKTYLEQVSSVLDMKTLMIVHNSEWLAPLTFRDIVKWTAKMTVARIMERDDFSKRFREGSPISLHEFMYIFMQAYDSVFLKADVELGGQDQLFNLMAGRDLMRAAEIEPQVALTVPLLVGTEGTLKMSKSYGNHVGVRDEAFEMFSKIMRIPDSIMTNWYTVLTSVPLGEVRAICDTQQTHPRDAKRRLAREIVSGFHGAAAAKTADDRWLAEKSRGEIPEEIPPLSIGPDIANLVAIVRKTGLAASNNEARRLIEQGGVEIDGEKLTDLAAPQKIKAGAVLRVGKKKRYFRLVP
ncbi:MAG TPA: tyrosine--tRNA ligase [Planctomycetota bacterium]|nr:tyrosine--tRNA ligase [Planctomycetota bacterium]